MILEVINVGISYQRADVSLYKSVDIGKKAYNCSEYSKVCNQSCKLIQQQSTENGETLQE